MPSPLKVLRATIWFGGIIVEVLAAGVVAAVLPIDNLTRPLLTKMAVLFSPPARLDKSDILSVVFSATSTVPMLLSMPKRAVELGPVMISSPGASSRSPTTAGRPLKLTVPRISSISSDRAAAVPWAFIVSAGDGFAATVAGFVGDFEAVGNAGGRSTETILVGFEGCLGDGEGGLAIVPRKGDRLASTAKDKLRSGILVDRPHVNILFIISILSY